MAQSNQYGSAPVDSNKHYSMDGTHEVDVKEALGLFMSTEALREALTELDDHFTRGSISVLGEQPYLLDAVQSHPQPVGSIENDPNAPRQAPIRTEEKVIGSTVLVGAAAYVGAAAMAIATGGMSIPASITAVAIGTGTGAGLGAVLLRMLHRHFDKGIEEQMRQGGILLWVRTQGEAEEALACDILRRHGAQNVRVHSVNEA